MSAPSANGGRADGPTPEGLSLAAMVRLRYLRSPSEAGLDAAASILGDEGLDRLSSDAFLDLIPLLAVAYPDTEEREARYTALVHLALAEVDGGRLSELLDGRR